MPTTQKISFGRLHINNFLIRSSPPERRERLYRYVKPHIIGTISHKCKDLLVEVPMMTNIITSHEHLSWKLPRISAYGVRLKRF